MITEMKERAIVVALFLAFGIQLTAGAEQIIQFSHTEDPATAKGRAADFFAEEVNKRLVGKHRVEVVPGGKHYGD